MGVNSIFLRSAPNVLRFPRLPLSEGTSSLGLFYCSLFKLLLIAVQSWSFFKYVGSVNIRLSGRYNMGCIYPVTGLDGYR